MNFYLHEHVKTDKRKLWLYSEGERSYTFTNDLPPVENPSKPIKRMHPLRGEPVFYNPGRNTRTLNPPPDYNPLAPVAVAGYPGEIPVTDFEVAIFQNRWPGLMPLDAPSDVEEPAYGQCEVVVYTPDATGSLADLSETRISLLLNAIGDRAQCLFEDPKISYVLPFENRGAHVGTTLPHPHGQIYAFEELPPAIENQMKNATNQDVFSAMLKVEDKYRLAENDHAVVICPPFSRYPFEIWLLPKQSISNPKDFNDTALKGFASLLKQTVRCYDTLFSTPVSYAMWHALPARGFKDWPYHIQFWPLQRGEGKHKFLASVEQITGLFLNDVLPEEAAEILRKNF